MSTQPRLRVVVASWFDGRDAQLHQARLRAKGDAIVMEVAGREDILLTPVTVAWIPPATAPRPMLQLVDGSTLVLPSPEAATGLGIAPPRESRIERAWRSPTLSALAAAASAVLAALAILWGIPHVSETVATHLPWQTEATIGVEALQAFDSALAKPSEVPADAQQRIRVRFAELVRGADLTGTRLEFRKAPGFGPNAFALPGRILVATDALVATLGESRALDAVLAHELGHVHYRHGTRALMRESGFAVIAAMVLHDQMLQQRLGRRAPQAILEAAHSRDAEREADAFAFALLARTGGAPADFVEAMTILQDETTRNGTTYRAHFLNSHPPIDQRIDAARRAVGR